MKFGKNLSRNQVPEWSHSYIKYRVLKKLIGRIAEGEKAGAAFDTTEFFYTLDRNLEDVDSFYNKRFADASRRLKLLNDQYGKALDNPIELDENEVEDLIEGILELRSSLRKLQWYGEVNHRGFVKITKKLDKKVPSHKVRKYVESRVNVKPFASATESTALINRINQWLSKASEVQRDNESGSEKSAQTLPRVSAKAVLEVPRAQLDHIDYCVRTDDVDGLFKLLNEVNPSNTDSTGELLYQRLLLNILQRAISCRSEKCISLLLKSIRNLEEGNDFNQRNFLHRLVLSMTRTREADSPSLHPVTNFLSNGNFVTPAAAPLLNIPSRSSKETAADLSDSKDDKSIALLTFVLDHLSEEQRGVLKASDNSGRIPLHYAAQFGLVAVVRVLSKQMQKWDMFVSDGIYASFWKDADGLSAVHLSINGNHYNTTKALIQGGETQDQSDLSVLSETVRRHASVCGEVLALATDRNAIQIVKLLVQAGVEINFQDEQGETALHIAARHGFLECATVLLAGATRSRASLDITEKTFGWTPLFIACVDGHLEIVKLLLDAGADPLITDVSGWRASEHATLRGHMKVAECIVLRCSQLADLAALSGSSSVSTTSLGERKSNGHVNGSVKTTTPVKSFGHRYLKDESMVLVSLGSLDMRKTVDVVSLDRIPLATAHKTQLDTALSMVVSTHGASGEPAIVDLPVQDGVNTEPIEFMTSDASNVKILFDIVPRYAGSKDKVIGRGVALLGSLKPNLGSNRMALHGDLSVPIVASHNLEVIGCVNFNFLVVTPFHHPNISISEGQTYWKKMAEPVVIGHRGLGKNEASRTSLQLGENTIQSFITAASLGAQYVEFDVQLTKDHVPVIYHDFLVSETGIDAPVHLLTLEQFMHVSNGRAPRQSRPGSPTLSGVDVKLSERKSRSMSVGAPKTRANEDMDERMKHTRDFKQKGFKANSRSFIQAPFTTLEEMFHKLPEHIGFNIEVKYPMLHESEEHEMDTYAVELNHFVDTVLNKVFDHNRGRNIIMSSFNPDICLLLGLKQPSIPVFFLTDAGLEEVGDVRASSLQEAVRFASRSNLLGIVSAAAPLCLSPRLVQVVKESGLLCVSYGTQNNDPKMVKLQVQNGIDAVIVDSVLAIRKGLTDAADISAQLADRDGLDSDIAAAPAATAAAAAVTTMTDTENGVVADVIEQPATNGAVP